MKRRTATVASVLMMLVPSRAALLQVSSADGKLTLGIDEQTGEIQTLQSMKVRALTVINSCTGTLNSVTKEDANVVIKRTYCCKDTCASTEDTIGRVDNPEANEIGWSVSVEGTGGEWSSPITTAITFEDPDHYKVWMPWNKPNSSGWTDPLQLEPFTNTTYNTGLLLDGKVGDTVITEHVTLIPSQPQHGISLISNPGNYPHHGKVITTSSGSVYFQRDNALYQQGVVHTFNMHFSIHGPTFRAGLAHSLSKYSEYWNPINSKQQAATYDGMGSYTWVNDVPQNLTLLKDINYKVNWDLSGRFFPYMGMFLPPVDDSSVRWENDPEGTQTHINVTYDFIDSQYLKQKDIGAVPLSYYNIFEYGLNVKYNPNVTKPTGHGDWRNASEYLTGFLRDSLVTDFSCYSGCGHGGTQRQHTAQGSWQGAVVMDPSTDSYNNFLMKQATQKLQNLKQFTGIVIDRSDWCQMYTHQNPGYSYVNNATATNYAGSWVSVTKQLRDIFGPDKTILYNTVGFASLSLLRYTDGTFSEGHQVNAAGILGVASPAVLWTYDATECCSSQTVADLYFQTRLYMRVYPMAPYPGNDHSIPPGDIQNAYYLKYGAMYRALDNVGWELGDNIVTASGLTINTFTNRSHVVAVVIQANADSVDPIFPKGVQGTHYLLPGSSQTWTAFNKTAPLLDGCVMLRGLLPTGL